MISLLVSIWILVVSFPAPLSRDPTEVDGSLHGLKLWFGGSWFGRWACKGAEATRKKPRMRDPGDQPLGFLFLLLFLMILWALGGCIAMHQVAFRLQQKGAGGLCASTSRHQMRSEM